jgi:hypothetical protein
MSGDKKLKISSNGIDSYIWADKDTSICLVEDYENEEIESDSLNLADLKRIIENASEWEMARKTDILSKKDKEINELRHKEWLLDMKIKELESALKTISGLKIKEGEKDRVEGVKK